MHKPRDKHSEYIQPHPPQGGLFDKTNFENRCPTKSRKIRSQLDILLSYKNGKILTFIYFIILPSNMKTNTNENVDSPVQNKNTLDYQSKPISVKLTKKLEEQLDYIAEQTQMSRSNIIRYSITLLHKKIQAQEEDQ